MDVSIESIHWNPEVAALLSGAGLPVSDLGEQRQLHLFGARHEGKLLGVVGIEAYASVGLLRSLAVAATFRKLGHGHALLAHAEQSAAQLGIEELFLLTTTAADFFARHGYLPASRRDAPRAIAQTTQFSGLCPVTASLMRKRLLV